jgi:hypothetical protein
LGGQWLNYNSFTDRVDILYVKKQKQSLFNTVWSLYQETIQQNEVKNEATNAETTGLETPQKTLSAAAGVAAAAAAQAAAAPAAAAPRKRKGEEHGQPGGPAPKQPKGMSMADKDNQKTLRAAQATKILYNKVCTVHTARMISLTSDGDWADLATPATMSRLVALYDDMVLGCQESFAKEFLHHELIDLKKKYKDDMAAFYFNIKNFEGIVAAKVKGLETEQMRLNRMHLAGKATAK